MAEVPPHLLERSRSRRAALGQGGDAPASDSAPAAQAVAAAVPATTAAAAPAAAPAKPAGPKGPIAVDLPVPKPVAPARPRIPMFALPVLLLLPIWGLFYAGNWIKDVGNQLTPEQEGAKLYGANCSSCHGANGAGSDAGGVGRPLWNGNAEKTFKTDAAQMAFVRLGSDACKGRGYGDAGREGGQHIGKGGMPGEWTSMTDDQLRNVIAYERNNLSGKPFPTTTVPKGPPTVPTTIAPKREIVCP